MAAIPETDATTTAPTKTRAAIQLGLLNRPGRTTLNNLSEAKGWQRCFVRAPLSGKPKKKGFRITFEVAGDVPHDLIGGPK